jgi:lipopolysaccharide transport system permease protein
MTFFLPDKSRDSIKVYEPNYMMKAGIRVWADMVSELLEFRGLIWRLIVRDITARYKQSILGILWAFIAPLIMMLIFVWVKSRNILPIGETEIPYAAFVFMGQMVWLLFSQGVITSANSMVAAGNMLTKINFPREVLILSAIGQTIFYFLIRIPLLTIIFMWVGFTPKLTILLTPLILLPLLLLIVGLGFLASLFNALTRDIRSALGIIINLGMFVTPVIYPAPNSWPFSFLINTANPISSFVNGVRDLSTTGHIIDPLNYLLSVVLSLLIFFVGWRFFHLAEPKIAERL